MAPLKPKFLGQYRFNTDRELDCKKEIVYLALQKCKIINTFYKQLKINCFIFSRSPAERCTYWNAWARIIIISFVLPP